ncbi:jg649, partial [Pararge aegeria aegeria]
MTILINQMKIQDVLEVADSSPSFLSTMFLVPKSNGSYRPIFNLRALNEFVSTDRFKLINIYRIPDFLQPRDWLCKIDLSQAYYHLAITRSQRRFLRLIYNGELLQMTCLPFGLSTAPKVFASMTNWIAQTLREKGIRIIVYLDDFLLAHQNVNILRTQVQVVLERLQYLGWQVNFKKSELNPQMNLVYLGIHWDPWLNQKRLPSEKYHSLLTKVSSILRENKVGLKCLQSLVGHLNFASFAVPKGRLNHRSLLDLLNSIPKTSKKLYVIPAEAQMDLKWWLQNYRTSSPIHIEPPTHFLTTDASDLAWGAQLDSLSLSGPWNRQEAQLHCNQKEMLAIFKVLQGHYQLLQDATVLVQCDSRTVVAYLRNEGGTISKPLTVITKKVFGVLDEHNIVLKVFHLPGKLNILADRLSRYQKTAEWHLVPSCTEMIFRKFGVPVDRSFCIADSTCSCQL